MKNPRTLEQFIAAETEAIAEQIATSNGHIGRLTARKAAATDEAEQQRLQELIDLQIAFIAETNKIDATAKGTEKFNKQQERQAKMPKEVSGN